jgi:hypothetical protein
VAVTCVSLANVEKLDTRLRSLNVLGGHPDPDVRRTVAKHDALAGLEFPQKTDDVTIREYQVRKVQHDGCAARDCVERLAELADVLGVEATADRQHDGSAVSRAMNFEHLGCSERNCRSNRKRVNLKGVRRRQTGEISPVAKSWTS